MNCINKFVLLILVLILNLTTAFSTEIVELNVSQIIHQQTDGTYYPINIGFVNLKYIPTETGMYLNVLATLDHERVGWIGQNIYLPNMEMSMVDEEILSFRFNFLEFGNEDMIEYDYVILAYSLTDDIIFEPGDPDLFMYQEMQVYREHNNASGMSFYTPVPEGPILKWRTRAFRKPTQLSNMFLYGCSVPNIDLDNTDMDGVNGCGPAATSNSMLWMKKLYDGIDFPLSHQELFDVFCNLTDKEEDSTVSFDKLVRAKLDFIEMYDLPIKVQVQSVQHGANTRFRSTSGQSHASCENASDNQYPTQEWLFQKGKENCDVEMVLSVPGSKNGHCVTLTGGLTRDDTNHYIKFKHDLDQVWTNADWAPDPPRTKNERSPISIVNSPPNGKKMVVRYTNVGDEVRTTADITHVISECYDKDHKPREKNVEFSRFCQYKMVIVPPNSTITFDYPEDSSRCFNSTIYETRRPAVNGRRNLEKRYEWNFNSGESKSISNDNDMPLYLSVHCDDNKAPRTGSGNEYEVGFSITQNEKPDIIGLQLDTSPSNSGDYGGFSIGGNDDSHLEFSELRHPNYDFNANIGCSLLDFPERLGQDYVGELHINYALERYNEYWTSLSFILDVDSIVRPGQINIIFDAGNSTNTIDIQTPGRYIIDDIGGLPDGAMSFDCRIFVEGDAEFFIDNMAFPSNIDMTSVEEDILDYASIEIYPNPIMEKAKISITLNKKSDVKLDAYDILGNKVDVIYEGILVNGKYNLTWDTQNLNSGVYIIQLTTSDGIFETKKVIIIND